MEIGEVDFPELEESHIKPHVLKEFFESCHVHFLVSGLILIVADNDALQNLNKAMNLLEWHVQGQPFPLLAQLNYFLLRLEVLLKRVVLVLLDYIDNLD